MTAESISYNGKIYSRDTASPRRRERVYFRSNARPRTALHRDVYLAEVGPIPDGWHIHHLDHDPLNNDPSNLIALDPIEHNTYHANSHPGREVICEHCSSVFTAYRTHGRWCSTNCREKWRRAKGLPQGQPKVGPFREERVCAICGAQYVAKKAWARYCGTACRNRNRYVAKGRVDV